jgi:hypothetical protein
VESEEGDENEEGKEEGLSDQDEALSAGDGSSYGGGSEFGLPTLANLVELNKSCCRVPTRVASSDGSKVAGVCGRSVGECRRHGVHRINGRYRHPVTYYV